MNIMLHAHPATRGAVKTRFGVSQEMYSGTYPPQAPAIRERSLPAWPPKLYTEKLWDCVNGKNLPKDSPVSLPAVWRGLANTYHWQAQRLQPNPAQYLRKLPLGSRFFPVRPEHVSPSLAASALLHRLAAQVEQARDQVHPDGFRTNSHHARDAAKSFEASWPLETLKTLAPDVMKQAYDHLVEKIESPAIRKALDKLMHPQQG